MAPVVTFNWFVQLTTGFVIWSLFLPKSFVNYIVVLLKHALISLRIPAQHTIWEIFPLWLGKVWPRPLARNRSRICAMERFCKCRRRLRSACRSRSGRHVWAAFEMNPPYRPSTKFASTAEVASMASLPFGAGLVLRWLSLRRKALFCSSPKRPSRTPQLQLVCLPSWLHFSEALAAALRRSPSWVPVPIS